MPLYRRLPKVGFNNFKFATRYVSLNVGILERFPEGSEVTPDDIVKAGIVKKLHDGLKLLGEGEPPKNLKVTAHRFSATARQKIEAAGGSCTELNPPLTDEQKAAQKPKKTARAKAGLARRQELVAKVHAEAAPADGESSEGKKSRQS